MLIPLSWIKDYLDLNITATEIADTLTLAGLEVDKVEKTDLGFENVVVAKVLKTSPHPEADRLQVAEVSDGTNTFQIVCGATNCREGLVTALAKVGAKLTDLDGKILKIKKGKLRGVESCGMLCAEEELGLSSASSGIIELSDNYTLGTSLEDLYGDIIFEISLTPNLGHCTSVIGVARELAALLNLKLKQQSNLKISETISISDKVKVTVENPDHCYRYAARYLENIEVGPSPSWLKARLEACGIRSINNIVDVTNYVMLSLGQPMHAFDYDKLQGSEIIVKTSKQDEQFTTLDDIERTIPKNTLMIFDIENPAAIAGVMGGLASSVTENTTRILLEAAHFDPSTVRKSCKALNLRTDSSSRFEKNIDPKNPPQALELATSLLSKLCPNLIVSNIIDEQARPLEKKTLCLRKDKLNKTLGTKLSLGDLQEIFTRLDFNPKLDEEKNFIEVEIPSYRNDILSEIDLVEEVARIYGYHNIPDKDPACHISNLEHSKLYLEEKKIRSYLVQEGLQECVSCNLISPKLAHLGFDFSHTKDTLIEVLQPSSIDQSILRPSLLPNLLQAAKLNADFQNFSLPLFEIGKIHFKDEGNFHERPSAAILLTGGKHPHHWQGNQKQCDYFDLKGILENLFEKLRIKNISFSKSSLSGFHPGRQANIYSGQDLLGIIGEVHPNILSTLDIEKKVYFAELNMSALFQAESLNQLMQALPQFPGSDRDWTLPFSTKEPAQNIFNLIRDVPSRLLKSVSLLDEYTSESLGAEKRTLTFRFHYRDDKKTLELKTVEKEHSRIISMVESKLQTSKK